MKCAHVTVKTWYAGGHRKAQCLVCNEHGLFDRLMREHCDRRAPGVEMNIWTKTKDKPDYSFAKRVAAWNSRAAKTHLTATLRWADKLAQEGRKPLAKANWWHGEPYGKRPASVSAWSGRLAKKNPPTGFRATVSDVGAMAALVKLGVDPGNIEMVK